MSDSTTREKTIRWSDPLATAMLMRDHNGLDALRAMSTGVIPPPPIAVLFGFRFQSVEPGKVQMSIVPDESHYNPMGMVHGGAMATLLDTVMGCSVLSVLDRTRGYTTLGLSINYIRAITISTGEVFAEGTVIHAGRSTAIAHGRVVDAAGKLYATADTTCMVFDRPA
ncbi:MAG: PaaI family thioesterase [Phycisphaerae bacterium]|nr:PaaI family thioesterase [Gemmatimonadaceae bacterium]